MQVIPFNELVCELLRINYYRFNLYIPSRSLAPPNPLRIQKHVVIRSNCGPASGCGSEGLSRSGGGSLGGLL